MSVVVVGWALFYFTDFGRLFGFLRVAFRVDGAAWTSASTATELNAHLFWLVTALVLCVPVGRWWSALLDRLQSGVAPLALPRAVGIVVVDFAILFASTSLLVGKSYNPFLYFRF